MTGSRTLRVGCEFVHVAEVETATVLQVEPDQGHRGPAVVVQQGWSGEPDLPSRTYVDAFGNSCRRVTLPVGRSTLRFEAAVTVPDATEDVDLDAAEIPAVDLPDDVLAFTLQIGRAHV